MPSTVHSSTHGGRRVANAAAVSRAWSALLLHHGGTDEGLFRALYHQQLQGPWRRAQARRRRLFERAVVPLLATATASVALQQDTVGQYPPLPPPVPLCAAAFVVKAARGGGDDERCQRCGGHLRELGACMGPVWGGNCLFSTLCLVFMSVSYSAFTCLVQHHMALVKHATGAAATASGARTENGPPTRPAHTACGLLGAGGTAVPSWRAMLMERVAMEARLTARVEEEVGD